MGSREGGSTLHFVSNNQGLIPLHPVPCLKRAMGIIGNSTITAMLGQNVKLSISRTVWYEYQYIYIPGTYINGSVSVTDLVGLLKHLRHI